MHMRSVEGYKRGGTGSERGRRLERWRTSRPPASARPRTTGRRHRACLDGGVSVSLKETNTKTNTFHPNICVSLVLVGTNTPKKLTPPRGGNWC
jgi:hypothetical protein